MDKERLEDIKENSLFGIGHRTMTKENFNWIVSTVEEQQKEIEMYKNLVAKGTERRVEDNKEWFGAQSVLVEENARLRKALEFYADGNNYEFETIVSDCDIEVESKILEDTGEKARQALKE
ncbi:hypothetical protein [Siminovitchia terrae]|uniref:hypothetical protein n=1 Tax=Siminovitchia terrae TaxID=1914933 RepID=UPI0028AE2BE4|nr:hypothetical protein [Siminovitchia terrae]